MKAYTFQLAPSIEAFLRSRGYDTQKLQQAIEAHGNANLKQQGEAKVRVVDKYSPEKVMATKTQPAASKATSTIKTVMVGDGSNPRLFAGWHYSVVQMIGTFGELTAIPLPVACQQWLNNKFRSRRAKRSLGPKRNGSPKAPKTQAPKRETAPTVPTVS